MHARMHVQHDATCAEVADSRGPRYKEAVNECTSALDVAPNNQKALLRRAKALEAMGLYKQALSDVQKVNKLDDAPPENQVGTNRRVDRWRNASAPQPPIHGGSCMLVRHNCQSMVLLKHPALVPGLRPGSAPPHQQPTRSAPLHDAADQSRQAATGATGQVRTGHPCIPIHLLTTCLLCRRRRSG